MDEARIVHEEWARAYESVDNLKVSSARFSRLEPQDEKGLQARMKAYGLKTQPDLNALQDLWQMNASNEQRKRLEILELTKCRTQAFDMWAEELTRMTAVSS